MRINKLPIILQELAKHQYEVTRMAINTENRTIQDGMEKVMRDVEKILKQEEERIEDLF